MPLNKLIKAILLNIFIIPGSGHFFLKQKLRGTILSIIVVAILISFIVHINVIIHEQLATTAPKTQDFREAYEIATTLSQGILVKNMSLIKTYVYGLITCYLFGIIDLIWIYVSANKYKPNTP